MCYQYLIFRRKENMKCKENINKNNEYEEEGYKPFLTEEELEMYDEMYPYGDELTF